MFSNLFSFSMNRFYQGDWIDSMASRFIEELPEKFIEKNEELSISAIITSPDIYWPIFGFFIIIILAFIVKQFFFKKCNRDRSLCASSPLSPPSPLTHSVRDGTGSSEGKTADGRRLPVEEHPQRRIRSLPGVEEVPVRRILDGG